MPYAYTPTYPIATRPDIPLVIQIGHVTRVLSSYDLEKNKAFRGGSRTPSEYLPMLLGLETEILEWLYTRQPSYATIENCADYVWSLIGAYAGAALRALGNGNGIIINPVTGAPLNIQPYRDDFAIGGIGGLKLPDYPFVDGDTSYTVPLSGFFIAFLEPSGVNEMIRDTSQASITSIDYLPTFVRFNLNQPVRDGEKYVVWGLRGSNITNITGGNGTPIPLPLQRGKFLGNDGTNLLWDDVWIPIDASQFEPDGKTYIDPDLDGYYLALEWLNVPVDINFETDEATLIDGGGFIVNLDNFDTTQNPDWRFRVLKKSLL